MRSPEELLSGGGERGWWGCAAYASTQRQSCLVLCPSHLPTFPVASSPDPGAPPPTSDQLSICNGNLNTATGNTPPPPLPRIIGVRERCVTPHVSAVYPFSEVPILHPPKNAKAKLESKKGCLPKST